MSDRELVQLVNAVTGVRVECTVETAGRLGPEWEPAQPASTPTAKRRAAKKTSN